MLHPVHRELLAVHINQHAGCTRFGLFINTEPKAEDVNYSTVDVSYMFVSTWRKTHKSNRPYTIRIPCRPDHDSPAMYEIRHPGGTVYLSAGDIFSFYQRCTGLLHATEDTLLYPILAGMKDRRKKYAQWLRYVYTSVLPENSTIPSRIRPHSARAGWATDRARQNTPHATRIAEGRWSDERAMMDYVRECVRDLCTTDIARIVPSTHRSLPLPCFGNTTTNR